MNILLSINSPTPTYSANDFSFHSTPAHVPPTSTFSCPERGNRSTVAKCTRGDHHFPLCFLLVLPRRLPVDKDVKEDSTVLSDFRNLVPLTDYEAYRPWVTKFFERPCKLSEVENLLAPGLPNFIAITGSTSGSKPKYFARYLASLGLIRPAQDLVRSGSLAATIAGISWWGYRDVVEVTAASGDVVTTVPVTGVASGFARSMQGWPIDSDNARMASMGESK